MPIEIILDANIPKKVKKMNGGSRVLHIGDIDTQMEDGDIIDIAKRLGCLLVTHDRKLAVRASERFKALFIKDSLSAEEIVTCIEKNMETLKKASIFCENCVGCNNCRTC